MLGLGLSIPQVGARGGGGGVEAFISIPMLTNHTIAPFNGFAIMFNLPTTGGPYTPGVDYDFYLRVKPSQFPGGAEYNWLLPGGTINGVGGHGTITHGNYDGSPAALGDQSAMICDITAYSYPIQWGYTGSNKFDALAEGWTTREAHPAPRNNSSLAITMTTTNGSSTVAVTAYPNGGGIADIKPGMRITGDSIPANATVLSVSGSNLTISANVTSGGGSSKAGAINTHIDELGLLFYDTDFSFHISGTLIGESVFGGVKMKVYSHSGSDFITAAPSDLSPVFTGTSDPLAYWIWLAKMGIITGSEWINGISLLGPEPKADTVSHGGVMTVNRPGKNDIRKTLRGTTAYCDLFGAGVFPSPDAMTNWSASGVDFVSGATGPEGNADAVFIREQTGSASNHEFYNLTIPVPARPCTIVFQMDFKNDKGRDDVHLQVASSSFANQVSRRWNLSTMAMAAGFDSGDSGLAVRFQEIIDIGGGYRRLYLSVDKKDGSTAVFASFALLSGGAKSYVGDTSKGITFRGKTRIAILPRIDMSGTPPAGYTGAAYDWTATWSGGQDPVTFSFVNGALPSGWSVSSSEPRISGTTATVGTVTGAIRATGADGLYVDLPVSIPVTTAVIPSNTSVPVITNPSVWPDEWAGTETLSISSGTWTGTISGYRYRWKADGAAISGQTANTLAGNATYNGKAITGEVQAYGPAGDGPWTAAALSATYYAGIVRVNDNFTGGQGTWSSVGNLTYSGGQMNFNGVSGFSGPTKAVTLTAGKTLRVRYGYSTANSSPLKSIVFGATNPGGTVRSSANTSPGYVDNIVVPAAPTAIGFQTQAVVTGVVDNVRCVELA